jgi:anaerobic selenocysteine-containing dehydrogenase
MTFGMQTEELESLEWKNATYTVIFNSSITKTRIPYAKQLKEAKKKAKVVVVDLDFCETAANAAECIPIKADTDAAFALGSPKITNIPINTIKRIVIEITKRKPLHIIYGASNYQWYNGDLKGRAISLLAVLTGNIGISSGGISTYAGQYNLRFNLSSWWSPKEESLNWVPYLGFLQGKGK